MTRRILVTDGQTRAALAITRSLGRAGHTVFVCAPRRRSIAGASRFCAGHHAVTNPLSNGEAFVREVRSLCETLQIDTLIPVTEESLLTLLRARADFPGVVIPFPDYTSFAAISDKQHLLEVANSVGIATPDQAVVRSPVDASQLPLQLTYPVVVKPARSVSGDSDERVKLSAMHAANAAELTAQLATIPAAAYPLLIQQRVVGPGVGVFLLIWDGEVKAWFAHRRLREKPPSGGVSVYCESITVDPALRQQAADLLARFEWRGVAMVELKIDAATARPYLMEVNGRFWGSLQLAIDAGVDFPNLLVQCAHGQAPATAPEFKVGVRSRWWWGDVDHLIARLRRSRAALALPAGAGTKLTALREFLRLRWRDKSDVFRVTDPLPLLQETVDWLARR